MQFFKAKGKKKKLNCPMHICSFGCILFRSACGLWEHFSSFYWWV